MSSETFKYLGIAFAVAFIILIYLDFRKSWALKREMSQRGIVTKAEVISVIKTHDSNWSEKISDQWNDYSEKVRYEVGF